MAGRGPAPKSPDRRGGHGKKETLRVIHATPTPQPPLPTFEVEQDGELVEFVWPARTQEWWSMWGESPLAAEFTSTDWSELLDTALLHARFWKTGATSVAAELRLRVAKFGATPEDRARLRITFAQAEEADQKVGTRATSSRDRYQGLNLAEG